MKKKKIIIIGNASSNLNLHTHFRKVNISRHKMIKLTFNRAEYYILLRKIYEFWKIHCKLFWYIALGYTSYGKARYAIIS